MVIHKAVSAFAGIGGVAACGIGRFRNHGSIDVVVARAALPDLDIIDRAVIQAMSLRSDIGEQKILPIEPVRGGILIGGTHIEIVQRTNFYAIHIQPDHIRAILRHAVFQTIDMTFRAVDAVICQGDAVVITAAAGSFAHGNEVGIDTFKNVPGIVGTGRRRGEQSSTGGAGSLPGILAFPLHAPGLVVAEHDGLFQRIAGGGEHTIGAGACQLSKNIFCVAVSCYGDQVASVKLPAVVCRCMIQYRLRCDDHIRSDQFNGHNAIGVATVGDILTTHGNGNFGFIVFRCSQGAGKGLAREHLLVHAIVRSHIVQLEIHGVSSQLRMRTQKGFFKGFRIRIHTEAIGMHTAVTDVGVKILLDDAAVVDVHNGHAEMGANRGQILVEGFQNTGCLIGDIHALRKIQIIDLRIRIADTDFVHHNGSRLQRGSGFRIGIGTIAVVHDQCIIADVGSTQGILVILVVIGTPSGYR